jgi:prolyl-tRNA synthetase
MKNMITGANAKEKHILNVNIDRDFKATAIGDLINAPEGEMCPHCDGRLSAKKGIEVGNTFMLGTKYSKSMNAKFLDADGNEQVFIMGSYGIGITRTPQAAVERYHDENGIIWPKNIAPYQVEIIPLNYQDSEEIKSAADKIYSDLIENGIDCLMDDRSERAGVKFNDADLIGLPVRIVIGQRNLKNGQIELRARTEKNAELVDIKDVIEKVTGLLERLN